MSYSVQKLPTEPIILFTAGSDFDTVHEMPAAAATVENLLDTLDEPVIYVADHSAQPPVDMEALMVGVNEVTRGSHPLMQHQGMKRAIFVTTDAVLKAGFQGMQNAIFGNVNAEIYDTLQEALTQARM